LSIDEDAGASNPDSIGSTFEEDPDVVCGSLGALVSRAHVTNETVEFNGGREIDLVVFILSSGVCKNRVGLFTEIFNTVLGVIFMWVD
jgi:hypothetical protein